MAEQPNVAENGQSSTATLLKAKKLKKPAEAKKTVVNDPSNVLLTTAAQIENLTKEEALAQADMLFNESGMTDFRLGGVMAVIQTNAWYDGYDGFRQMVEQKFGLHYRKAMYLIQTYKSLVEHQIPWGKVKGLGWTKLKEIASVITPENVDMWVSQASMLTVLQLQEAVKAATATKGEDAKEAGTTTSTVTTLTFKVHTDQKDTVRQALDKCKAETNTEFDTVALANICMGYLGGSVNITKTGGAAVTLDEVMGKHTYEEVLQAFEKKFPDVNLTVSA